MVAILVIRVFRALIALTASFKLTVKQYNTVNTFINNTINKEVFINYPKGINLL